MMSLVKGFKIGPRISGGWSCFEMCMLFTIASVNSFKKSDTFKYQLTSNVLQKSETCNRKNCFFKAKVNEAKAIEK